MSETSNNQLPQIVTIESGQYEYSYQGENPTKMLHIFSLQRMERTSHTAQETLDLLHFLQRHEADIEVAAQQQADELQKPKRKKSVEERVHDLFT